MEKIKEFKPFIILAEKEEGDGRFFQQVFEVGKEPAEAYNILPTEDYVDGRINWETKEYYEGATPEEIAQAELEKVPKMINQRQMKLQMLYDGISETSILAVINAIPDEILKGKILVEWQYANYFERLNENLIALWLQLGKSESELNTFFINASKL